MNSNKHYHDKIVQYYRDTEYAYRDSWDLNNSLAIHYGYKDEGIHNFPDSLIRMNEVMMQTAAITTGARVLDAGCGVGGSSIYLAEQLQCRVTGITLSQRQVEQANGNAIKRGVSGLVDFACMDYSATSFRSESFDIVWGCESICYADNKEAFIREAFRLLKPGGRLIVADGFVTEYENNDHPVIRKWLDGWQVNYLETPGRFSAAMTATGFQQVTYRNITSETLHSAKRLYRFYFPARLYLAWRMIQFWRRQPTAMQKANIAACKFQYKGMRRGLWQYGLITGQKQ